KANLAPGATAKTDGWAGYSGAPGVTHDPHVVGRMAAHVVLPWTHRVFANLKRWALGVYHGLRRKHLQTYLDAFVFRFNRRRTRHASFRSLLGIADGMRESSQSWRDLLLYLKRRGLTTAPQIAVATPALAKGGSRSGSGRR